MDQRETGAPADSTRRRRLASTSPAAKESVEPHLSAWTGASRTPYFCTLKEEPVRVRNGVAKSAAILPRDRNADRGESPAYDYQLSISTTPAIDLPCDVGEPGVELTSVCFIDLVFQFPTFDTQLSRQEFVLDWVVSSASDNTSLLRIV
ncbi:hypothetical protein B0T26DRAFT_751578 [Lasiosphaeria miniovina]|uniref:Uncharacterized protein n=1 Tax=Lasiosphaeria miniovina TaxID=1954250 RepID=A0AA40AKI7_9PEZI|nr:uncharacterized protein B0T26DRAFT_751578 [Lasiosphaeria miniovina]KAK0717536.1 hypothetical protein B0T26DRAFT_751578 [Lasiosphaeria miniovina]